MKDAVICIIFNEAHEVLLVKRRDMNLWVLPGGGIEEYEDPQKGGERETFEETGLHVVTLRKVGEYTPISRLASLTHVFECKAIDGRLTTGDETRYVGYFALDRLPKNFFHIHQEWLDDALSYYPYIVRKPIKEATFWKLFIYLLKHPIRVLRGILSRFGIPINT